MSADLLMKHEQSSAPRKLAPLQGQLTSLTALRGNVVRGRRKRGGSGVQCNAQKGPHGRLSRYTRVMTRSDGLEHLGSALRYNNARPFPGPPGAEGPPLRVLPVGGLGEIGMNCMLIGLRDRYILLDAGLMFPDVADLGMQKILPDVSFLAQWRDKIEAVIITHGHEDHIGAMPWVLPALDPATPVFSAGFSMQLIKRRMMEFNMWDESRFHIFGMRERFQAGPFEVEPFRVTHSIPDCCGLVLRSEAGNILHTGDWKIDEDPIDGEHFDRPFFEAIGREGCALFMSDSTNVLTPGRTTSEQVVQAAVMEQVLSHAGKGRIIATQFASNLHRLTSMKRAADAAGRKIAFIGTSLYTYLEAAWRDGRAPFDPRTVVQPMEVEDYDPNELLIITTGSQAEPRAALSLAARNGSNLLKLQPSDLLLYSAKVIPGNENRVTTMMNAVAQNGTRIVMGREANLHTSGHAYKEELREVMRLVKPQHFLPVHGEYAFLCAHAELAQESGVRNTSVIRNGQMLGVSPRANNETVSTGSLATAKLLGEAQLELLYNDGNKGTGSATDMAIQERSKLALDGIIVAAIDIQRVPGTAGSPVGGSDLPGAPARRGRLRGRVRVTTRGMWTDDGRLLDQLHRACEQEIARLPFEASLTAVERYVCEAMKKVARQHNNKFPDIVAIVHEMDPRAGAAANAAAARRAERGQPERLPPLRVDGRGRGRGRGGDKGRGGAASARGQGRGGGAGGTSIQERILSGKKPAQFQLGKWPSSPLGTGADAAAPAAAAAAAATPFVPVRQREPLGPALSYDDGDSNWHDDPDELAAAAAIGGDGATASGGSEWGERIVAAPSSSDGGTAVGSRAGGRAGASARGGAAAHAAAAEGPPLSKRRRMLKAMKKAQLLEYAQQYGVPEGKADELREALVQYVREDGSWAAPT